MVIIVLFFKIFPLSMTFFALAVASCVFAAINFVVNPATAAAEKGVAAWAADMADSKDAISVVIAVMVASVAWSCC